MLTLSILGSNRPHCAQVERHVRTAMRWLEPQDGYEIIHITDEALIRNYANRTPAIVINDEVVCEGCIPAPQNIVNWASQAMQTALKHAAVPVPMESMAGIYGE